VIAIHEKETGPQKTWKQAVHKWRCTAKLPDRPLKQTQSKLMLISGTAQDFPSDSRNLHSGNVGHQRAATSESTIAKTPGTRLRCMALLFAGLSRRFVIFIVSAPPTIYQIRGRQVLIARVVCQPSILADTTIRSPREWKRVSG